MKILFAIKNMKSAKGGAEKVLSVVANGLSKKGYDITILTFDERCQLPVYKLDDKIKRISLAIGKSEYSAGYKETFARMRALRKVIKVRQPDVVIPFMHSMFIPTAFALIGLKVKIIASEHIVPMHYKNKKIQYYLLILSSFFVDKITVISKAVENLYPRCMQRKMVVIPNPVEVANSEKIKKEDNNKIILNVGRLSEQKDQKTLIRAFGLLTDKYPNWTVRIVGEGEHKLFLTNLIRQNNLSNKVLLVERTDNIEQEYKNSDVFAMPSRYEGFGLVTAEAMSYGLPAVGFVTCAGTNEIITHNENGILVERNGQERVKNFAAGLELLMQDINLRLRLGEQAKKDIVQYQPELVINKWENLIQKTVQ